MISKYENLSKRNTKHILATLTSFAIEKVDKRVAKIEKLKAEIAMLQSKLSN
jgi:hypothetical protein